VGETNLGAPAEHSLRSRRVGSDVAYVAHAVLACHDWRRPAQTAAQLRCHLADGHYPRRPHVQRRQPYGEPGLQRRKHRRCHIETWMKLRAGNRPRIRAEAVRAANCR
jgi:hypothetical protein